LQASTAPLPPALAAQTRHLAPGLQLRLPPALAQSTERLAERLRGPLQVVETDDQGRVQRSTALQLAGVLDDLYAAAAKLEDYGVTVTPGQTRFRLWAPTAERVALCLYDDGAGPARRRVELQRDPRSGAWAAALPGDLSGGYYLYLVDVHVRGSGRVRNRVTDPYSLSLTSDSRRSWIGRLDAPALQPEGWAGTPAPDTVSTASDLVVYELHVRDFSADDDSVSPAHRGKYLAFTEAASNGMRHLQALAAAGVSDVHLLPVFDFAGVPETGCVTPAVSGAPDSDSQQAAVVASARVDCYNWGYDPWHYGAPEGSYASDAADGAVRILEFRRMVQALHRAGLRVGMDLVYNHTSASGQDARSVLDRIVPGYYQRLDAHGAVENSTCCANTATENRMMAKLMIDTAVRWARDHHIDSFRFDLMGHQPRAAMEQLQQAVDRASGRHIPLVGEGWNFGEVANGARFVQATQLALAGTGIATFSDRARDALRGGGCCDGPADVLARQGWLNGLGFDPNPYALQAGTGGREELLRSADLVRVGLAGTLRDYRLRTFDGSTRPLAAIDYTGQPAGYASHPGEVVNYVENHDGRTLFDIDVLKLPPTTGHEDRARVQVLGLAVTAFSQGIAYFHAGVEALRSKNLDRDSYDSSDWFNRLDWTFSDNHFGTGLPPRAANENLWPVMRPLLADPALRPVPADIRWTRDAFFDLLRIRASSRLFRLRTAEEVADRLVFLDTGPGQTGTAIAAHLDGQGLAGAGFAEILYAVNADKVAVSLSLPTLRGRAFVLHPVHLSPRAADTRPVAESAWDSARATLKLPPRTALVYVLP
jgi:pullulanase/glycogen debranching enzyme